MRVTLNGEPRELPEGLTVADLLADLGLGGRRIAVEINREVLPRERYPERPLRDGDTVEIVHFLGGG